MPYETSQLLARQSYENWISQDLFSFQWFLVVGILVITYIVWIKLLDKKRIRDILLLGSLSAVGFLIANIVLASFLGLWEYKIAVLPIQPNIFMVGATIAPILYMVVLQYTSSWRNYIIWASIGTAVLAFGLLPLYSLLGIFQLHKNWNYFYHFLMMLTNGIIARAILVWFISIEQRQTATKSISRNPILQPAATKPINKEANYSDDRGNI